MDSLELLRLHMALECIAINADGDLVLIPCPNPDDIHRLYIARHADGYDLFFRHDVPQGLRSALQQIPVDTLFHEHDQVKAVFERVGAACTGMHSGRSYVYPANIDLVIDSAVQLLPEDDLCRLVDNGEVVATCRSIRHDDSAAEAYVFTAEGYRQQGYGRRVVQAWAQRVRENGRVPFYSHVVDNMPSQRLAESLGFVWYIDDVGYE